MSGSTSWRAQVVEQAIAWGYRAGWAVVRMLPSRMADSIFVFGADAISQHGAGMNQLRKNLTRVVGAENVTKSLVRTSMRSYARYWKEAFCLPSMVGDPRVMRRLDTAMQGKEALEASVRSGRGVIIVLPHSGNWDMAGMYLAHAFGPFTTVAERLKPESLYRAFVTFRETLGFEVLPLTGGVAPFSVLKNRLIDGGIVCLLGERDLRKTGINVEFFGEQARMPAGPVKLAMETGAALHVGHVWFEDDGWGLSISPEVQVTDVSSTVQRVADIMQENISAHPEDWHVLQPLWIADLNQDRFEAGLA
ncbi:Lipid A biosynthesis lauroyl acyltransferase [Corynebacterium pseudotuberculosis]|uniref:phosphatidylinositol mannoside acyltransferase n=1 Tax=Corynebacterium pseudotuberculosis TaxID=1719 RepID=UPI00065DD479|nr:phosphatidylinositol mannoside acyltransferase [Corynebacterium pseudotuberculosis]AKP08845.1 Lipid A biosynthesis lauroyl acyltransferase [Corynebacterium pseudotuberculosis]